MKFVECPNCGYRFCLHDDESDCICCNCHEGIIINSKEENKDKIYTLAHNGAEYCEEQVTYIIDENKKIKIKFYFNGWNEGMSSEQIKKLLDFLGVKYFECIYNKLPEKYYKEYKEYDWE